MGAKVFYEVPAPALMFGDTVRDRPGTDKDWAFREEAVRQWCIQELIRTYGIRIDCIEIERLVKVAQEHKAHHADIVVLRDNRPYVVVECKSRKTKKLDEAITQATNYATNSDMKATFAVATNGDQWVVYRYVNGTWLSVVDLPLFRGAQGILEWQTILQAAQAVSPILFWLDSPVPAKFAAHYFLAMQQFFNSANEITVATERNLLSTMDNLLRVLYSIESFSGYTTGKMNYVCKGLNDYFASHGMKSDFGGDDFGKMVHFGRAELLTQVANNAGITSLEVSLLRLVLALFSYLNGIKLQKRARLGDVPENVRSEVRNYINLALVVRFNAALPDPLDETGVGDIRSLCKSAWEAELKSLQ